ncbi:peptidylprolyl isomerase [Gammaproteobacteria bacterium]|nr:peptidylprolyl isomerase [Gammaproteobacteria bacterium]MDA8856764.1 peptidylprolyl isomerase [Gammaproteobacteria bacterium]MDA9045043.1 peptidylprolyl isomerase [Gammaproteobacteria bacterium]MDC0410574.1 peptidylprolyl isomerase [Gammaproteobacteria bacterium]|tara:strand:- start:307 stop:2178 length:1872 start_codon:yes stop_codon:yes gene_type:complete
MDSLRNFLTGYRLAIIIALLAIPFVFLGSSSLGTVFGGSLGSINGEEVSEVDYQFAANMRASMLKEEYGEEFNFNELDEEIQIALIKQELIAQKVFLSEARSLGLINDEETNIQKKLIINDQAYKDESGNFSETIFESLANQNGFSKSDYIEFSSSLNSVQKYKASLSNSTFQLPSEIQNLASILEKKVDVDFIKIDFQELKNNIKNSLEDQVAYYNNNQELFLSDELRSFDYFVLSADDYKDKVNIPTNYTSDYYEDYVSRASASEQQRISHVMVDKSNYNSDAEAQSMIESINQNLQSGSSFEDIVSQSSEDIVTKDNGGDLEYFDDEVFPVEFGDALKGLGEGELTSIIELESSFHILKVTEVTKDEIRSFEDISEEIVSELISSESLALLNDDYSQLDDLALEGRSFVDLADFVNAKILSGNLQAFSSLTDLDQDVKNIIFDELTELNLPKVIDLDGSIYVVAITEIKNPELKIFSDVQTEVNNNLININASLKKSAIEEEFTAITNDDEKKSFVDQNSFASFETFKDIKRYSSLLPQEVLTEIFNTAINSELSLTSRNGDHYFVNINKFNPPSQEEMDEAIEQYSAFDTQRLIDRMNGILSDDLFDKAKISLNEQIFN